jgi:hypothetical protein
MAAAIALRAVDGLEILALVDGYVNLVAFLEQVIVEHIPGWRHLVRLHMCASVSLPLCEVVKENGTEGLLDALRMPRLSVVVVDRCAANGNALIPFQIETSVHENNKQESAH